MTIDDNIRDEKLQFHYKLKEIEQLQNNIKLEDLDYTTKRGKKYGFSKYSLAIAFSRDLYEGNLSLEDAHKEQSDLVEKLSGIKRGRIVFEKRSFLKNLGLFLSATENCFNNFKSKIFPLKKPHEILTPNPTPGSTVFDTP